MAYDEGIPESSMIPHRLRPALLAAALLPGLAGAAQEMDVNAGLYLDGVPMEELAVYEVADGKVIKEQFFYNTK